MPRLDEYNTAREGLGERVRSLTRELLSHPASAHCLVIVAATLLELETNHTWILRTLPTLLPRLPLARLGSDLPIRVVGALALHGVHKAVPTREVSIFLIVHTE